MQNGEWIGISIISQIEFMSYRNLAADDIRLFEKFVSRIETVGLTANPDLLSNIYNIRKQAVLKLPDAIIAGTAIWKNAILISEDTHFAKQKGLMTLIPKFYLTAQNGIHNQHFIPALIHAVEHLRFSFCV